MENDRGGERKKKNLILTFPYVVKKKREVYF